jgi:hypothetical protein
VLALRLATHIFRVLVSFTFKLGWTRTLLYWPRVLFCQTISFLLINGPCARICATLGTYTYVEVPVLVHTKFLLTSSCTIERLYLDFYWQPLRTSIAPYAILLQKSISNSIHVGIR